MVLRQLEDLNAKERKMVELDNRKDQIMTVLKVALSNVGMLVRDQYFPLFMLDLSQKLRSRGVEVTRSKRQK